jgi:hypothetical protein
MLVLLGTFLPSGLVQASASATAMPILSQFIRQLSNGRAGELRGVYVPQILAAGVVQQPDGEFEYVSDRQGMVTQFSLPSEFGTTGLLAHNYLAGARFSLLKPGQILYLIYGDGKTSRFAIREIQNYQALNPLSSTSDFVDLGNQAVYSARELFDRVYNQPGRVIFQTCIARDEEASWGRLFAIAEPSPAR